MERLLHNDDFRVFDSLVVAIQARQLDCGFIRLTAGVAEKHAIHA